jgi:hypothetical protein
MVRGRNDIPLMTQLDGEAVSHFRLREFENREGLAMVHPGVLLSLERVRRDLGDELGEEVWLIITGAVRTDADLERLAARFGWIDEGGTVSRDSKHLAKYGGIAVDLVAVIAASRERVSSVTLGRICRKHFDWVKDDYGDGHVHADNRGVLEAAD